MLPVVNLDDEYFEDIVEKAKKKIPSVYPEWTDYNEHDPGITFLQLLSWMKEMQQFHLDQIGKEHQEMFLKILGIRPKKMMPAKTVVKINPLEEAFFLPQGSRMKAGNVYFETCYDAEIIKADIAECVCISDEQERISGELLKTGKKMRILPFGKNPQAGNSFLIKFVEPLEAGKRYSLYFDMYDDYPVTRNPIDNKFYPLAELEINYFGETGFAVCKDVEDYTYQLLQSGIIQFIVPQKMEPMEDGTYGICIRLKQCEYDVIPVLQALNVNVVEVEQIYSVADYRDFYFRTNKDGRYEVPLYLELFAEDKLHIYEKKEDGWREIPKDSVKVQREEGRNILYIDLTSDYEETYIRVTGFETEDKFAQEYDMTGFPYQQIMLNDKRLVYQDFEVMAEIPGRKGMFVQWEKVDNFHSSLPTSCHYKLDEEKGMLVFGDCEHGMAPEGRLRIVRCSRSLGVDGNVRKGQIHSLADSQYKALVCNQEDVSNGTQKELIEDCFKRYQKEAVKVCRAITEEDYETLVLQTPGLRIKKVKVVPAEFMKKKDGTYMDNCISVVVQPYSSEEQARLGNLYVKNIVSRLNEKRMIGTKVQVLSPEYIGVSVYADVVVKPHYLNAREIIESTVARFFEQTVSDFGTILEESALYGWLDAQECVLQIRNLTIHAQGKGVHRKANGNIQFPANGLAYLKQVDYMITAGNI